MPVVVLNFIALG